MGVYILIDTEDWPRNNFIQTSPQVAGGHKRTTISENIVTVEARKCGGLKKMNSSHWKDVIDLGFIHMVRGSRE